MANKDKRQYRRLVRAYMNTGDPVTEANFGEQAASIQSQHTDTLALLKFQRAQIRSQGRNQRADIRQQGRYDVQGAVGSALERGILGGSADVSARQQVRASTQAGLIASRDQQTQNLAGNLASAMQAKRDKQAAIMTIMQQRAAAKAMGGAEAYLTSIYDALSSPGSNRGSGGPQGSGPGPGGGNNGGSGGDGVHPGWDGTQPDHPNKIKFQGEWIGENKAENKYEWLTNRLQKMHASIADEEKRMKNGKPRWGHYVREYIPGAPGQQGHYTQVWRWLDAMNRRVSLRANLVRKANKKDLYIGQPGASAY